MIETRVLSPLSDSRPFPIVPFFLL